MSGQLQVLIDLHDTPAFVRPAIGELTAWSAARLSPHTGDHRHAVATQHASGDATVDPA